MNGKVISGPAAVLIVVFFFLPWITVSCNGQPVGEFSGYHLASGTAPEESADLFSTGEVNGDPILFVIPLVGVVTLALLAVTLWKPDFEPNASWGQIIAAFIGLLVLALEWFQLRSESEGVFDILIQPALWGTAVTLIAVGAGAVLDLVLSRKKEPSFPYMAPPPQKKERSFVSTFIAPRERFTPQESADNYTILDEELMETPSQGRVTLLDEDVFQDEPVGNETILDDELIRGGEYGVYTDVSDELADFEAEPPPTAAQDDAANKPAENVVDSFGWVFDDTPSSRPEKPAPPTPEVKPPPAKPATAPLKPPPDLGSNKTEVLHIQSELLAWLVVASGERRGEQFRLFSDTTIGRDLSNDIVIDDTAMSSRHARIRGENGRFFIFDQNSTNGVFVFDSQHNRWEKRDACELHDGDQIKMGRTVLHLMTSDFNK